jgi:hypothetical protein
MTMDKISIIENKGTQLFRDDEMIARKNVSQQEFEEQLGVENALKIISACANGAEKSKNTIISTPPSFQNRNFKSNTWNCNIQGYMTEEFPNNSGFCKGRRFYVELNGLRLFFKKVDNKLKPQNIITKAVQMYDEQLSDNIQDTLPITYIGYQVSSSFTELIGVYAVHIVSGTVEWFSDLSELVYINKDSIPLYTQPTEDDELEVVPKANKLRGARKKQKSAGE